LLSYISEYFKFESKIKTIPFTVAPKTKILTVLTRTVGGNYKAVTKIMHNK
jgi:hypothetical protein